MLCGAIMHQLHGIIVGTVRLLQYFKQSFGFWLQSNGKEVLFLPVTCKLSEVCKKQKFMCCVIIMLPAPH
jgi:hypothetical protein